VDGKKLLIGCSLLFLSQTAREILPAAQSQNIQTHAHDQLNVNEERRTSPSTVSHQIDLSEKFDPEY
jgi:hypothetical protein